MEWITVESTIECAHRGDVGNRPSQHWVRIAEPGNRANAPLALVANDPEGRAITGCPNSGPNIKMCAKTLRVDKGYSGWVHIGGRPIVLSHLDGLTDGTVPGTVHYNVTDPRQHFVRADR
ncbi:MAG: hypothetical protein ACRDQW_05865 [Haloechinothrix sp.]